MTDALRNALKLIDKHSVATVRTNSKDRGDWAEDMAYVGKVARDALAASAAPAVPPGWVLETGVGGFGEKGDRWVCVRHLESQCGQDFYEDRDPLIFAFLSMLSAAPTAQQEPQQ